MLQNLLDRLKDSSIYSRKIHVVSWFIIPGEDWWNVLSIAIELAGRYRMCMSRHKGKINKKESGS